MFEIQGKFQFNFYWKHWCCGGFRGRKGNGKKGDCCDRSVSLWLKRSLRRFLKHRPLSPHWYSVSVSRGAACSVSWSWSGWLFSRLEANQRIFWAQIAPVFLFFGGSVCVCNTLMSWTLCGSAERSWGNPGASLDKSSVPLLSLTKKKNKKQAGSGIVHLQHKFCASLF